jgi:hypothetical protein
LVQGYFYNKPKSLTRFIDFTKAYHEKKWINYCYNSYCLRVL